MPWDRTTDREGTKVPAADEVGSKGRPTPSRKQAEAQRLERLKASSRGDTKSSRPTRTTAKGSGASATKAERAELRKRMLAGDERALSARDRGPEKRYARQLVDERHTVGEYFLFLAIGVLVLGLIRVPVIAAFSQVFLIVIVVAIILDSIRINRGVSTAVRAKFPDGQTDGIGRYAMMRALVTRRMRTPAAGPRGRTKRS